VANHSLKLLLSFYSVIVSTYTVTTTTTTTVLECFKITSSFDLVTHDHTRRHVFHNIIICTYLPIYELSYQFVGRDTHSILHCIFVCQFIFIIYVLRTYKHRVKENKKTMFCRMRFDNKMWP